MAASELPNFLEFFLRMFVFLAQKTLFSFRKINFPQELIARVILLKNLNQRNKMKKFILCISALFTMTSVVFSADSAGNRADSIIMLGTSGGIHPATIIAPPLRLGILLGADWMLGIDAGSSGRR